MRSSQYTRRQSTGTADPRKQTRTQRDGDHTQKQHWVLGKSGEGTPDTVRGARPPSWPSVSTGL